MPQITLDLARPADVCWAAFTDASQFAAWMPGLRHADVLSRHADGRAREVHCDFSTSLSYSLLYTYNDAAREVRWEPHQSPRDALRGFARFDARGAGSRLTYKIEQGANRRTGDLVRGGVHPVIDAFARWLETR